MRRGADSYQGECAGCGASFTGRDSSQRYCSKRCGSASPANVARIERARVAREARKATRRAVFRERRVYRSWATQAKKRAARLARPLPAVRACEECGARFDAVPSTKRYCAEDCAKKAHKRKHRQRRRATERAAAVETVNANRVFERDGWRCQLCGVGTPRSLRGKHKPNSPELDHIIPLSVGGEHSYANTQCLCRSCNASKGASVLGQLRLDGAFSEA